MPALHRPRWIQWNSHQKLTTHPHLLMTTQFGGGSSTRNLGAYCLQGGTCWRACHMIRVCKTSLFRQKKVFVAWKKEKRRKCDWKSGSDLSTRAHAGRHTLLLIWLIWCFLKNTCVALTWTWGKMPKSVAFFEVLLLFGQGCMITEIKDYSGTLNDWGCARPRSFCSLN